MKHPKQAAKRHHEDEDVKPLKIAIEGNIGSHYNNVIFLPDSGAAAGKSTFLKIVESHFEEFKVVQEPLARWTNVQPDDEGNVWLTSIVVRAHRGADHKLAAERRQSARSLLQGPAHLN